MAAALELLVLPAIILTVVAFLLLTDSMSGAGIAATAVVLGLLYFVVIKLLRDMRKADRASERADLDELHAQERAAERAARREREAVAPGGR